MKKEDVTASYDAKTLEAAKDLGRYIANYLMDRNREVVIEDLKTKKFLGSYQYKGEWEPEC